MTKGKQTSVYFNNEIHEYLLKKAEEEHRTVSSVINVLVRNEIERESILCAKK